MGEVRIFGIGMGAVAYLRIDRIRRLAERDGWRRRSAHFRVAPGARSGQPGLVLDADDVEAEAVLSLGHRALRGPAVVLPERRECSERWGQRTPLPEAPRISDRTS